jgi:DNA-directed RNA polymerase subunit RPC12/RpoP
MLIPEVDLRVLVFWSLAGTAMGFACGLRPMRAAQAAGHGGLGFLFLLACMGTGLLCGFAGALPLAWLLTHYVRGLHSEEPVPPRAARNESGRRRKVPPIAAQRLDGPFTVIGTVVVCNRCKQATSRSKTQGQIPEQCPHCGFELVRVPTVRPTGRGGKQIPVAEEVVDLLPAEGPAGGTVADSHSAN